MAQHDWTPLLQQDGVNSQVDLLHQVLADLLNLHFPLKICRSNELHGYSWCSQESDLPWLDSTAKKMIKKKQAIYKSEDNDLLLKLRLPLIFWL